MVRGRISSCFGPKYRSSTVRARLWSFESALNELCEMTTFGVM